MILVVTPVHSPFSYYLKTVETKRFCSQTLFTEEDVIFVC